MPTISYRPSLINHTRCTCCPLFVFHNNFQGTLSATWLKSIRSRDIKLDKCYPYLTLSGEARHSELDHWVDKHDTNHSCTRFNTENADLLLTLALNHLNFKLNSSPFWLLFGVLVSRLTYSKVVASYTGNKIHGKSHFPTRHCLNMRNISISEAI